MKLKEVLPLIRKADKVEILSEGRRLFVGLAYQAAEIYRGDYTVKQIHTETLSGFVFEVKKEAADK